MAMMKRNRTRRERRAAWGAAAGVVLCTCGGSALSGCLYPGDHCWEEQNCEEGPQAEPAPPPCETDPATAPAEDRCGVFVSPTGSDANLGTRRSPYRTLQKAIDGAVDKKLYRVYACEGLFEREVTLPTGVDLWGGRRCAGGSWVAAGPEHLTVIAPRPVGIPLRVLEGLKEARSMIFGVRIEAADASAPDGKSSIGMILSPLARAHVRSSEIVAGDGKDGEDGDDAPPISSSSGTFGIHGADSCTVERPDGAPPVITECEEGGRTVGGRGGDGGWLGGGDGQVGIPWPAENPTGSGQAGTGSIGGMPCTAGADGASGADGESQPGMDAIGTLSIHGWKPPPRPDGRRGGNGQGGGGGGGGRVNLTQGTCIAGDPTSAAAGGSGGSGGCGGRGGGGGSAGGSSIGVVMLEEAKLALEATWVATGNGGRGGDGGVGQAGGRGKDGGNGGRARFVGPTWGGCPGGDGGNGGSGGNGGGGLGGHSIVVASLGTDIHFMTGFSSSKGSSGLGGLAGGAPPADPADHHAAAGRVEDWQRFPAAEPPLR
jgi:hypothetical protein